MISVFNLLFGSNQISFPTGEKEGQLPFNHTLGIMGPLGVEAIEMRGVG